VKIKVYYIKPQPPPKYTTSKRPVKETRLRD